MKLVKRSFKSTDSCNAVFALLEFSISITLSASFAVKLITNNSSFVEILIPIPSNDERKLYKSFKTFIEGFPSGG